MVSSLGACVPGTPASAKGINNEPHQFTLLTPSTGRIPSASAPTAYQSPNFNLTKEGYEQLMHRVVKTTVFPKCKFITRDEELEHGGAIARAIMKDFGIKDYNDPVSIRWWEGHKDLANKKLGTYRNNRIKTMSKCYKSKMQDPCFACVN